jgi:hypothetical protein
VQTTENRTFSVLERVCPCKTQDRGGQLTVLTARTFKDVLGNQGRLAILPQACDLTYIVDCTTTYYLGLLHQLQQKIHKISVTVCV